MISSPGIGSGLDVQSIVRQLMSLERRPLQAMQTSLSTLDTQLSAYGRFRSALSTFQSALSDLKSIDAFQIYSATSTDADAITAVANSSAAVGSLDVQVNRLAQNHKQGSLAQPDTGTTAIGGAGDQMTITVDGNPVTFDVGGMTLSQIRDAINDGDAGVTATIVSETATSHRLVLTSIESGAAQAMDLAFTGSLGTELGMTTINNVATLAELDSEIIVDNVYTITRGSNSINDAIGGLTLNLKAPTASAETLTIARDTEEVTASVQSFVDAYNELRTTMKALGDKELKSDSTLRSIDSSLRSVLNTVPTGLTGSFNYLSQIGVTIQRDGTMQLDSSDLEDAIASDFTGLAEVFAHDNQGYLFRLDARISTILQADGLIDGREDGINANKKTLNSRIENLEYRLSLVETRYLSQFNSLDTMLSQLQSTSAFLTQQLSVLNQQQQR